MKNFNTIYSNGSSLTAGGGLGEIPIKKVYKEINNKYKVITDYKKIYDKLFKDEVIEMDGYRIYVKLIK